MAEISDRLAEDFKLTSEERRALLPSGKDQVFANRLGWARTYLKKAGLISYTTWGVFRITSEGQAAVQGLAAGKIDLTYLKTFPSFMAFYSPSTSNGDQPVASSVLSPQKTAEIDPEESIEFSVAQMRKQVGVELLTRVKAVSPQAFENLVVRLICDLGYGGSRKDAGEAIGRAGDGGLDGVIREDRLGLDLIYVQAKRWEGVVGRPVVQGFVGALHGKKARRGVIITTSAFTKEAYEYAEACADRIILIDGTRLVDLMFEYNIGVSVRTKYEVKEMDLTFFEQFV